MSIRRWLIVGVLLFLVGAAPASEDWPLVFPADPAWTIEKPNDELSLFVLTNDAVPGAFFTLAPFPLYPGSGGAASVVRGIADGVEEEAGWFERLFRKGDGYEVEELEGTVFAGEAAVWRYWGGDLLVVFMIEDGETGWNGQFSGNAEEWAAARELLSGLRRPPEGDSMDD